MGPGCHKREGGKSRQDPVGVTANFVSRSAPGPAEIAVEEISRSGQFQRFQARLLQGEKERVRGLFTAVRRELWSGRVEPIIAIRDLTEEENQDLLPENGQRCPDNRALRLDGLERARGALVSPTDATQGIIGSHGAS